MHRFRPALPILALAALCVLLAPAAAPAADSHAPRGARIDWLPADTWVMSSWLPFDEACLDAALGTSRAELATWLNDRRSLGDLAHERGVRSLRALAAQLVAPRLAHVSRARRAVLRRRALDMLTQAHLANHVLFHIFHTPAIADAAPRVFGVRPATFRRLRITGVSPAAIGARGGRSVAAVRRALRRLLHARAARAVRVGAMSRAQATALLAEQDDALAGYVVRPFRTEARHRAFLCRLR